MASARFSTWTLTELNALNTKIKATITGASDEAWDFIQSASAGDVSTTRDMQALMQLQSDVEAQILRHSTSNRTSLKYV